MKKMKWSTKTASEWGCILSPLLVLLFGLLPYIGIVPPPSIIDVVRDPGHRSASWPFYASLVTALVCAGLFYLAKRLEKVNAVSGNKNAQPYIYIGPGGTPIQLYNEKLRIDIRFFACGTLQLLHVKLRLGPPKAFAVTLSDAEPHEITAGQVLSKSLERLLTDEELAVLKSDIVLVQGTAKFGGNLEVPFVFQANPLRL